MDITNIIKSYKDKLFNIAKSGDIKIPDITQDLYVYYTNDELSDDSRNVYLLYNIHTIDNSCDIYQSCQAIDHNPSAKYYKFRINIIFYEYKIDHIIIKIKNVYIYLTNNIINIPTIYTTSRINMHMPDFIDIIDNKKIKMLTYYPNMQETISKLDANSELESLYTQIAKQYNILYKLPKINLYLTILHEFIFNTQIEIKLI